MQRKGEKQDQALEESYWASPVTQLVKNLPAVQETWVHSLCWEDPLENGKATHSVSWPGGLHGLYGPWGHKELDTTERLSLHFTTGLQPVQTTGNLARSSGNIRIHRNSLD